MAQILHLSSKTNPSEIDGFFKRMSAYVFGTVDLSKYILAKEVFDQVVTDTPRLTGWAQASWAVGAGALPYKNIPRPPPGSSLPLPVFTAPKRVRTSTSYVIGNFAPHIDVLNEGHSKQQPVPGFVVRARNTGIRKAYEKLNRMSIRERLF